MPEIIVAFARPHRVPSICKIPCEQCGETKDENVGGFFDHESKEWDKSSPPLVILREATEAEYIDACHAHTSNARPILSGYYYEVSSD